MELWQTLLLTFGGNAALLAILTLLAKSLLEKVIVRDIKHFEADLKSKSDTAMERLRGELHIRSIEHQVRFSRLHEKRATVIAELYGYLVEVLWEAESFLSPIQWAGEPNILEKHRSTEAKLVDFFCYFEKHQIYLPEQLCVSLQELAMTVRMHVINVSVYIRYEDQSLNDHTREQKQNASNEGWNVIKTQIPLARRALEKEFRALLGARPTL